MKVDEGIQDTEDRLTGIQTSLDIGHTSVWETKDFCIAQYNSEGMSNVYIICYLKLKTFPLCCGDVLSKPFSIALSCFILTMTFSL